MKLPKHLLFIGLITLLLFPFLAQSQSISGNIKDFSSELSLSYANVDIYKADKLVASVIADKNGDFNVKLDTGLYRCEILFAGYHKISQEFKVVDDEKAVFNLSKDKEYKFADSTVLIGSGYAYSYGIAAGTPTRERAIDKSVKMSHSFSADESYDAYETEGSYDAEEVEYDWDGIVEPGGPGIEPQATSGLLTAGEVNDFSKWVLWNDLTEGELADYQKVWDLVPNERYMFELVNDNGLPIANAKVSLLNSEGISVFQARTDNTGKAELWASSNSTLKSDEYSIKVVYRENKKVLKKAKVFGQGTNRISMDVECDQSQVVDIAFVVDATGSMGDELSFLKEEINDVIFKAKAISDKLNFRFANVYYRDIGDEYLTKSMNFSRVLSESTAFINAQYANGGGDGPEAVETALDTAINTLDWSEEARARILFLVLDAPPHQSPEINARIQRVIKQAAEKGIRIVPITASGIDKSTEYLMRAMALLTNGTYTFLTNHSGIGGDHLEPSTDSYEVEKLNSLMVRLIQSFSYMPDCKNELPLINLPYSDSVVTVPAVKDSTADSSETPLIVNWKYYPNPTYGIVNIVANVAITELHITDLSGKIIQKIENIAAQEVTQCNLYGYSSGIYLIRYPIGKRWVSGKIILMKES